ncbi:MAG TPA: tRNA(His) guanylyltransferase Thg1 family protein [Lacunisphaera sp.]|nr:tRNA(His) guanylyltransferase Thg1 family protein [Lacunisphaera sp.]
MTSTDSLGDRMKAHESAFRACLPPRTPVIIRVDGRAFHTYTLGLERPFSEPLIEAMNRVAVELCGQIQGARLAYVQSDEVSVLIHSYETYASQPWFGNEIQKMVSVAAGIASSTMTRASVDVFGQMRVATFDARVFALPEHEVTNYFLWRQNDASRNSVQMLARSMFSHRRCHGLNQAQLNELCFTEGGKNWNDLPTRHRRGRCIARERRDLMHWQWVVDNEIPIWKGEGREYIERLLKVREGEAA